MNTIEKTPTELKRILKDLEYIASTKLPFVVEFNKSITSLTKCINVFSEELNSLTESFFELDEEINDSITYKKYLFRLQDVEVTAVLNEDGQKIRFTGQELEDGIIAIEAVPDEAMNEYLFEYNKLMQIPIKVDIYQISKDKLSDEIHTKFKFTGESIDSNLILALDDIIFVDSI